VCKNSIVDETIMYLFLVSKKILGVIIMSEEKLKNRFIKSGGYGL
jgi:hypothetical protein